MNPFTVLAGVGIEVLCVWVWWRFMCWLCRVTLSGLLIEKRARQLHREGKLVPSDTPSGRR